MHMKFCNEGFLPLSSAGSSGGVGEQSAIHTLRLAAHWAAQAPCSRHCWPANAADASISSAIMANIWKQYMTANGQHKHHVHCSRHCWSAYPVVASTSSIIIASIWKKHMSSAQWDRKKISLSGPVVPATCKGKISDFLEKSRPFLDQF